MRRCFSKVVETLAFSTLYWGKISNLIKEALLSVVCLCRLLSFELRFLTVELSSYGVDKCLLIPWVEKISTKLPN